MSLAVLFHFLCAQHVSDNNISIISCASACKTNTTQTQPHQISNTQRTENKTTDVVIQQHSRKLLMTDILMSETCWAHKKWNKIASDIKLVFHSSTSNLYIIFLLPRLNFVFACSIILATLRPIQSTSAHSIPLESIIILSSILRLYFSAKFPFGSHLHSYILYPVLISYVLHAAFISPFFILVFCEKYELWSPSFWSCV